MDKDPYYRYVYTLARQMGFDEVEQHTLAEMAVFKKMYEGLQYSPYYEKRLDDLLSRKHHKPPHCEEKDCRMEKESGGSGAAATVGNVQEPSQK